jgi:hypothetical protein
VNLNGNRLGADGAKLLMEGGAFSSSLTNLDLENNGIDIKTRDTLMQHAHGKDMFVLNLAGGRGRGDSR